MRAHSGYDFRAEIGVVLAGALTDRFCLGRVAP